MKEKLILVDAYNLIFRSYYAIPKLENPEGLPVNAVYGYIRMLLKYMERYPEGTLIVASDTGKKNFRHALYPEYKAHRKATEADLIQQFAIAKEATEVLQVPYLSVEGFEADDIIATLAKQAVDLYETIIISSDKDLLQLVSSKTQMLDPIKDVLLDRNAVKEKLGVFPDQVADYLAIVGDSSDNIKGIRSIGPKTAISLLEHFCHLDDMLNADLSVVADKKLFKALSRITAEEALFSKKLVALDSNVSIQLDDYVREPAFGQKAIDDFRDFLKKQNFESIKKRFEILVQKARKNTAIPSTETTLSKIQNSHSLENLQCFVKQTKTEHGILAIDFVFEKQNLEAFILSNGMNALSLPNQIDRLEYLARFVLNDHSLTKITFDVQRVAHALPIFSTLLSTHDIKIMYYSLNTLPGKEISEICQECDVAYHELNPVQSFLPLFFALRVELRKKGLISVYEYLDRPMLDLLHRINKVGVLIDKGVLEQLTEDFSLSLQTLEEKIYQMTGRVFNIGSTKQLAEVLTHTLNIALRKNHKTGNYKTNVDVLERLSLEGHEVADCILEWRSLKKLTNTYTEGLCKHIHEENSTIHSHYSLTSTSTGRLSSNHPNLQNIPIKTDRGKQIRRALIAPKGKILVSADYTQIELRLLAHIAQEYTLINELKKGIDLHTLTASQIFNIPIDQVDNLSRRQAKSINFGIIYGITPFGLAKQLKIPQQEAQTLIQTYLLKYPKILEYIEQTKNFARQNHYVSTIFGRRCSTKDINTTNTVLRKFAERSAINAPLQGSAADIIKRAMVKLDYLMQAHHMNARLIMQIHDEAVLETTPESRDSLVALTKKTMENIVEISVPLEVSIAWGSNLYNLKQHA